MRPFEQGEHEPVAAEHLDLAARLDSSTPGVDAVGNGPKRSVSPVTMLRMTAATHINPEALHSSPAFSQVVRVPADADTIYVGGQNGVGADGAVVGAGMAEQTRQAFANLRTCLEAAGAQVTDIVKWTILYAEGADVHAGLAAFGEFWPGDAAPPVITVAKVSDVGPPGALVEIEAVAAVRN
jgi:enamine deaminase RidA (YjgF/YER057c/UK114 family)